MAQVKQLAKLWGWIVYHTHDSRRSDPGFPDLVLVRGGRIIFAELKREDGKLTTDQKEWIFQLEQVQEKVSSAPASTGCNFRVYVWRPSDWPVIELWLE